MARRYGREDRAKKRAAGYAPHGELERVKKAVQEVYDGLYLVNFYERRPDGSRLYKAYLHSPTGPVVWATASPGHINVQLQSGRRDGER